MENSFSIPFFDLPSGTNQGWVQSGNNQRRVLIVLDFPPNPVLDDFLARIFAALEINTSEDALVLHNNAPAPLSFHQLDKAHHFDYVVFFGISFSDAGLRFRHRPYQPVFLGSKGFLFADPLEVIHEQRNKGIKEKSLLLWNALKKMFNYQK